MADDSSETSDESLDVKSEQFDPLKALYSPKVSRQLTLTNAPIYDNVSKFESILKNINTSKKVCNAFCNVLLRYLTFNQILDKTLNHRRISKYHCKMCETV